MVRIHTLSLATCRWNIKKLSIVLHVQVIEVVILRIRCARVTRLNLQIMRQADLVCGEHLPLRLVHGAVEIKGAVVV